MTARHFLAGHTGLFKLGSLVIYLLLPDDAPAGDSPRFSTKPLPASERPATWAVRLEKTGLANFYQVGPKLYRGAQPTATGLAELEKLGIKTVVNLRAFHSDDSKLKNTRLEHARFYMKTWHGEDEDVIRFLKIATSPDRQPVFVHCQHGSDRTGVMCATYRLAVQDWTKEEALREMTQGGYGFHPEWQNLIHYIQKLDVAKIRREAGLPEKTNGAKKAPLR